jgi:hypothetical protein
LAGGREYGTIERTRRIDGTRSARKRKAAEVIRIDVPELQIVPDAVYGWTSRRHSARGT